MAVERVAVFVDGFNLYHGICNLKKPHLKWVSLSKLSNLLIGQRSQKIVGVYYFSAFARHYTNTPRHEKLHRHEAYVSALEAKGVVCEMGRFAKRPMFFRGRNYKSVWTRHEEKQTDVAIASYMLREVSHDEIDRALIISCDTDLVPCIRVAKEMRPDKNFIIAAPPTLKIHNDLQNVADDVFAIKASQIEKALFGRAVMNGGEIIAKRPPEYHPPG